MYQLLTNFDPSSLRGVGMLSYSNVVWLYSCHCRYGLSSWYIVLAYRPILADKWHGYIPLNKFAWNHAEILAVHADHNPFLPHPVELLLVVVSNMFLLKASTLV